MDSPASKTIVVSQSEQPTNKSWDVYFHILSSCTCRLTAQLEALSAAIDGTSGGKCPPLVPSIGEEDGRQTTMYMTGRREGKKEARRAFIQACSPAWTPASWSLPPCAQLS